MTRKDRIKAFELRLDGCSWREIGRVLSYSATAVQNDLQACVLTKPRPVPCVYPAIRRVIIDEYGGSIGALADACGISYNAMYYTLSGRCIAKPDRQKAISAVIGITPEEAFKREGDD